MEQIVKKEYNIKRPKYAVYYTRFQSYKRAQEDSFVFKMRKELTEAGFFYLGEDDRTGCYYCGGGLQGWKETDVPWVEHARYFGDNCPYVKLIKGDSFIQDCKSSQRPYSLTAYQDVSYNDDDLEESRRCIVCLSTQRTVLFLPCKHFCTCLTCSLVYNECVFCKKKIDSFMKIYMV